jgi:hypothetical protein
MYRKYDHNIIPLFYSFQKIKYKKEKDEKVSGRSRRSSVDDQINDD